MTKEQALEITRTAQRCTQATLRAFGIEGIPKTGSGCLNYLTVSGFLCRLVYEEIPLSKVRFDSAKNYLINTKNHAMALVNGVLVDTMNGSLDKRIALFIWEITK